MGVLVEGVACVGFGAEVGYVAFGGGEAIAYGVVVVRTVESGCEVVCGIYYFAAGVIGEVICVGRCEGGAGLGAGGALAKGIHSVVVLADDGVGVGAGGDAVLFSC